MVFYHAIFFDPGINGKGYDPVTGYCYHPCFFRPGTGKNGQKPKVHFENSLQSGVNLIFVLFRKSLNIAPFVQNRIIRSFFYPENGMPSATHMCSAPHT